MGANLSSKLTLDGTQHNDTIRDAVKEINRYKKEVDSANKKLNDFSRASSGVGSSISSMMNAFKSGDFLGFANSARGAATAISSLVPAAGGAATAVTGLGTAITTALGPIGLIAASIGAIVGVTAASINKTEEFETSLRGLSALTGVTGDTLDEMGKQAIGLSMKYGSAAKDIVDSMKMIGSQAPQLLSDLEGLRGVTEGAMVLQKAADGMTVEDTAKAITTVMNQMNVAASESERIINSLAAGSQKGAGDVLYLTTAIEKCGTQASNAKMTYQQLVGAIETLAPKFSSADVAGTSLNAMLIKLTTQTNNNFNPAVVGLEKALENLDKANLSAADKLKLFGQSGLVAANTLIQSRAALKDMTDSVTDTNTAYEQMETKQGALAGMTKKLKASWDALLITFGESPQVKAVVAVLGIIIKAITVIVQAITKWVQVWNDAWNEIGQVVVAAYNKFIKPTWNSIVKTLTDNSVYKAVTAIFKAMLDFVIKTVKKIKEVWMDFKEWLGIKTGSQVQDSAAQIKSVTETVVDETIKVDEKTNKTKSTKIKIEYETGSLDDLKAKLAALQKKLTSKNMSLVDVEKTKKEIEELKEKIEDKEIELGIRAKKGSLENIESQISEIDDKIKKLDPTIDKATILDLQIKKDALEKAKKDTEAAINGVVVDRKEFKSDGAVGSLQYAQDKVSYYKQLIQLEVEGTENYEILAAKIKEWTAKENKIRLKVEADTSDLDPESMKYITQKISYYTAELELHAKGTPEYENALKELKRWTEKENKIKVGIELDKSGAQEGSLKWLETKISDLRAKIDLEVYGTSDYFKLKNQLDDLEKQEHIIRARIEIDGMTAFDKIGTIMDAFHSIDSIVGSMNSLADAISEGANAWDIFMSSISVVESVIEGINAVMQVSNVLTATSASLKAGEATASAAAGVAADAEAGAESASIAPKASATAANKALEKSLLDLAAAQIFAAHASIPIGGVGIASGMITSMMAAMGTQHAASASLQALANGGVIRGKTTVGDYNIARVNAGEMVLNQRQQTNLFRAIDTNSLGGGGGTLAGTVVKVKGSDLYLAFSNLAKEKSKIGKNIYQ